MARRGSFPVFLTFALVLLVALLGAGALPTPTSAVTAVDCGDAYLGPNLTKADCHRTQTTLGLALVDCVDPYIPPGNTAQNCQQTQTALAVSPTASAPPAANNQTGGTGGSGAATTAPTGPTATTTITTTRATAQTAPTLAPITPTVAAASPQSTAALSPTPTAVLPSGVEALVCLPGTTVTLTGEAPPGTPLLAYFAGRPVGGGFSRGDGSYTIDLLIGPERPGTYLVEVRERTSLALVSQTGCEVPALTPTPTFDPAP
jgi:hypothetical protein